MAFFVILFLILKDHSNCFEIYRPGIYEDGVYEIHLTEIKKLMVYCEMSRGGWTLIMSKLGPGTYFNRDWDNYVTGFGKFSQNYWMGFSSIREIVKYPMELRIELKNTSKSDNFTFIEYDSFFVESEISQFKLKLGNKIDGDFFDYFSYNNNQNFLANRIPNRVTNCVFKRKAGWWFDSNCDEFCATCSEQIQANKTTNKLGLRYDLVKMMIRPANFKKNK